MDTEKYVDLIKNKCSDKFGKFEELLLNCNKMYNLTAVTDKKDIFYKHFLDSVLGERFFGEGGTVAEIGSGGGFPSVPLMIVRHDLRFTLIESTGKKCAFLERVVENLKLNCAQVLNIRAEDGAHDKNLREKFRFVCARAVARLNTLCEYCLPYAEVGGAFIAYKGEADDEIKQAQKAVKLLGGEIERVEKYTLPENYGSRSLIVIRKIKNTPPLYPRGQGRERKNPL